MKKIFAFIAATASLGIGFEAIAGNVEWANIGSQWSDGANWVGSNPPADSTVTDTAVFGSMGASAVNPNLTSPRQVGGVNFLNTPNSYTIGGSALTIGASGIGSGAVLSTQTFSNALNTSVSQDWSNAGSLILNGAVDLNNSGATPRTLTLSGSGSTIFNGVIQNSSAGSTGNITVSGSGNGSVTLANANTYDGATLVSSGSLIATHDTALGSSNVTLTGNTAQLTLQGGLTNNYISDNSTLSMLTGSTINLNFAGTDVVAIYLIDGVAKSIGVYNSVNEPGLLFGAGSITVVPEPSTWAMMAVAVLCFRCANGRLRYVKRRSDG